jgi:hypothetical protein
MFDSLRPMTEDEYRDSPEYRKWEAENVRRSAAMAGAEHAIQGQPSADGEATQVVDDQTPPT